MNANELIEFQEDKASEARANRFSDVWFMQTANMLRQQQAEIERLTTKNLEWLAKWNEQQAEIEALKAHPVKELTYEDGIEECAQRAEFYAYMREQY